MWLFYETHPRWVFALAGQSDGLISVISSCINSVYDAIAWLHEICNAYMCVVPGIAYRFESCAH